MEKETGLKYSEYDETYYAMLIANSDSVGKSRNSNINPVCMATEVKDGTAVYTPLNKSLKNPQFMDFVNFDYNVFVSEKIKTQLDSVIPSINNGKEGPGFFKTPSYLKAGSDYHTYYGLYFPEYKFVDKTHLSLIEGSKGIIYHGDSTDGLYDITYISFKAGTIKKIPEEMRIIFELDFHKLSWKFCLKTIKEKIESCGATGIQFEKSKDRNWYNEEIHKAIKSI